MKKFLKAFTLIELIIVIAIIAILAAAIFVAVDPARRLHEARNARRFSDITTILDAVVTAQTDNEGQHVPVVSGLTTGEFAMIGSNTDNLSCRNTTANYITAAGVCGAAVAAGTTGDDCVNLGDTTNGLGTNYLANIPFDPGNTNAPYAADATNSRYYMSVDANGAVTVGSCDSEGEGAGGAGTPPAIELTR